MTKTKIVATIGPASDSPAMIKKLILAGVNVFRFNLKHNNQQWHNSRIERVENISQQINRPVAIMLDLQGPEIRIGNFEENAIRVKKDEKVYIHSREMTLLISHEVEETHVENKRTPLGRPIFVIAEVCCVWKNHRGAGWAAESHHPELLRIGFAHPRPRGVGSCGRFGGGEAGRN